MPRTNIVNVKYAGNIQLLLFLTGSSKIMTNINSLNNVIGKQQIFFLYIFIWEVKSMLIIPLMSKVD